MVPLDKIKRVTVRVEYDDGERRERVIPGERLLELIAALLRLI